ncbi:ABC transporter substrate-binding protein [Marinomonas ostreistagni]|uniref:ABC transporter substrate-binding protein n=1 Tax=Marinomonas ostreistagni TaxID=359209 RepID=UPI0019529FC6|nr:ABC transporter substrate-binding protein [Marinomonas ostreistagni]MBM6549785.1 ABC transporter substrate-binding protein [Marinomonas ostreistagni]
MSNYCLMLLIVMSIFAKVAHADTLTIYSATDRSAIAPLLEEFAALYPETNIDYVEFNTQELYDELVMPAQPTPDVVISSAPDLQVKLVNDGYALSLDNLPDMSPEQPWAQWSDELFGFSYEPIVFVYNKQAFAQHDVPTTHEALAEQLRDRPDFYNGRIGTYDAANSGLGYLVATQDEVTFSLTGRLQESLGRAQADIHCCTSILLNKLSQGELVFGYNLLGSYAMARALKDNNIDVIVPEDYALVVIRSAFVHQATDNPIVATNFIRYLRSPAGQKTIAAHSALLPLDRSLEPHSDVRQQLTKPTNFHPIRLGPELLLYLDKRKREYFLNRWQQVMKHATP